MTSFRATVYTLVLQEAELPVLTYVTAYWSLTGGWDVGAHLWDELPGSYMRLSDWCPSVTLAYLSLQEAEMLVPICWNISAEFCSNLSFLCPPLWDCLPEFYRRLSCEAAFLQTEQSSFTSEQVSIIITNSLHLYIILEYSSKLLPATVSSGKFKLITLIF